MLCEIGVVNYKQYHGLGVKYANNFSRRLSHGELLGAEILVINWLDTLEEICRVSGTTQGLLFVELDTYLPILQAVDGSYSCLI